MKKPETELQGLINAITMHEIIGDIRAEEKKQSQPQLQKLEKHGRKIKKEWRYKQK